MGRISNRPPPTYQGDLREPKKASGGGGRPRRAASTREWGHRAKDGLDEPVKRTRSRFLAQAAPTQRLAKGASAALPAGKGTDYGSAFVMADLTHTPAHAARLRMIDLLVAADKETPGGLFAPGRTPERSESHISVIEIPVADLPQKKRAQERASGSALRALARTFAQTSAPRLALDEDSLELFSGPRGPVKQFEVVSLRLRDPQQALAGLRLRYRDHGGEAVEKSAAMHLTLAYLKLGTTLDDELVARLLAVAREANGSVKQPSVAEATGWSQSAFYFSGRYSDREFARYRASGAEVPAGTEAFDPGVLTSSST